MKIGDKIRITCVYSDSTFLNDVKVGETYTVSKIRKWGFDFNDDENEFYCCFENDEDFEYELVDEEKILKECKEFEEQLKKKEEIKLKAKKEAKEYMEEHEMQIDDREKSNETVAKIGKNGIEFIEKREFLEELKENDKVNHPSHYQTAGGIEVIEYIASLLGDNVKFYHLGNVIKYVSRFDKKNGVEDLKKARFYLNKMIEMEDK